MKCQFHITGQSIIHMTIHTFYYDHQNNLQRVKFAYGASVGVMSRYINIGYIRLKLSVFFNLHFIQVNSYVAEIHNKSRSPLSRVFDISNTCESHKILTNICIECDSYVSGIHTNLACLPPQSRLLFSLFLHIS